MKQIYETLCGICGAAHVLVREPMSRHTTFRTGGPADLLVQPEAEQIAPILEVCRNEEIPWTVIGNGSNLLVGDGGIRGVVLEIGKQMSDVVIEGTVITAGAGAMLSSIASRAAAAELTGMEFASGIPGSLGWNRADTFCGRTGIVLSSQYHPGERISGNQRSIEAAAGQRR